MPPVTNAAVAWTLRRVYANGLSNTILRDHPTLARMRKVDAFYGDDFRYKVGIGNNQGIGSTLALAQGHAGAQNGVEFAVRRRTRYAVVQLSGETIRTAKNVGAVVDAVIDHTEAIGEELIDSFGFDLFRSGDGIRGRVGSISGNVITLQVPYDSRNMKIGMTLQASTSAVGTSPRAGTVVVTAIGEDDGTFTVAAIGGITGLAANDYLFREGDPGTCMEGMGISTPTASPVFGTDSFRTVDRGRYPVMLAGTRINDASSDAEEAWGRGAVIMSTRGAKIREVVTNPITFHEVQRRQNAKVMYTKAGGTADIGFEYIQVHTGSGSLRVFADPDCPLSEDRGFDPDAHYLRHHEGLPHILNDDGNMNLRMAGDDSVEWRWRAWCNYVQNNTARHLVVNRA